MAIFWLIIGFLAGYFYSQSKIKEQAPVKKIKQLSYSERQKEKIKYESDADRIKELNQLSNNETKFMRMLQREFIEYNVIIKNKRFYISDKDNYPIAIYEYRDGKQSLRTEDKEDGLYLFLYKGIISSESIKKDKLSIKNNQKSR